MKQYIAYKHFLGIRVYYSGVPERGIASWHPLITRALPLAYEKAQELRKEFHARLLKID